VATEANRRDVSQLEAAPDSFQIERTDSVETPRRLRLDKDYSGGPDLELVVLCGFIPHIKSRGQEKMEKRRASERKARRRIVESARSRMNRFRKIPARFQRLESSRLVLLMPARAFIAFRKAFSI
jgi:hypothetical protein